VLIDLYQDGAIQSRRRLSFFVGSCHSVSEAQCDDINTEGGTMILPQRLLPFKRDDDDFLA
jgi:hypothetical protein